MGKFSRSFNDTINSHHGFRKAAVSKISGMMKLSEIGIDLPSINCVKIHGTFDGCVQQLKHYVRIK